MNCPHCQENMTFYQNTNTEYYSCHKSVDKNYYHYCFYKNQNHFFLKINKKFSIEIGVDPAGYYVFMCNKLIKIKPFNIEDCNSIIDKYMKLNAFL